MLKRRNAIVGLLTFAVACGAIAPGSVAKADTTRTVNTTYTDKVVKACEESYENGTAPSWTNIWTLKIADKNQEKYVSLFAEQNKEPGQWDTPASFDMKKAIVLGDKDALNNLATKDAYAAAAGTWSSDYCLMALDMNEYKFEGEVLADKLSDYEASNSKRDDIIYTIINDANCWGGEYWTEDTGCQNAEAIYPYYDKYAEVKAKVDEALSTYYKSIMADDFNNASTAGEYIYFAALCGDLDKSSAVYKKFVDLGEEKWSYGGNAYDISSMARGEALLNVKIKEEQKKAEENKPTPTAEAKAQLKKQTVTVKSAKKTIKKSSIKSTKKYTIKASAKTKLSYKVVSGKKYIKVSKKGIVTVKKGIKKGTYKIVITASESTKYSKATKTVKLVIK